MGSMRRRLTSQIPVSTTHLPLSFIPVVPLSQSFLISWSFICYLLTALCFQFSHGLQLPFRGTHSVGLGLFLQLLQFGWWEFLCQCTSLTCHCSHQSPAWAGQHWKDWLLAGPWKWCSRAIGTPRGWGSSSTSRHSVSAPLLLEPCRVQELLALSLIQYLEWKWFLYLWDLNYLLIPRQAFRIWLCW